MVSSPLLKRKRKEKEGNFHLGWMDGLRHCHYHSVRSTVLLLLFNIIFVFVARTFIPHPSVILPQGDGDDDDMMMNCLDVCMPKQHPSRTSGLR